MNERTEELATEAWRYAELYSSEGDGRHGHLYRDKLVELIVKECAKVQHERFCKEGDISWDLLMQHFGIKEN